MGSPRKASTLVSENPNPLPPLRLRGLDLTRQAAPDASMSLSVPIDGAWPDWFPEAAFLAPTPANSAPSCCGPHAAHEARPNGPGGGDQHRACHLSDESPCISSETRPSVCPGPSAPRGPGDVVGRAEGDPDDHNGGEDHRGRNLDLFPMALHVVTSGKLSAQRLGNVGRAPRVLGVGGTGEDTESLIRCRGYGRD